MTDDVPATTEPVLTNVPTMISDVDGYRVYDPALLAGTRHVLTAAGTTVSKNESAEGGLILLVMILTGIGAAVLLGSGAWWVYALWFLAGAAAGFLVPAIAVGVFRPAPLEVYAKRHHEAKPFVPIGRRAERAYRLCELADDLASSAAWKHALVDPDRLLSKVIWSAVQRSGRLESLRDRLRDDTRREVDPVLLRSTEEEIRDLQTELYRVESNLYETTRIAHQLEPRLTTPDAARAAPSAPPIPADASDLSDSMAAHSRALRDLL